MTGDLKRLKREYARRQEDFSLNDRYASLNLAYLFGIQQRQRATINLLRANGISSLNSLKILEIGCGGGDVVTEFLVHRLRPQQIHGVDLLDRVHDARDRYPWFSFLQADGQHLPYASESFDIVLQYTVFSSIFDDRIKAKIAREILRVLRKPSGFILWYDFWLNPTNPQTRGIRKTEIKKLFPNCTFAFKKTTLAPPLARKLVPLSWTIAHILEKLSILNTHYLVFIHPE